MKCFKVYRGVFYKVAVRLFVLVPDFLLMKPLPNKLRFNWGRCFGSSLVDCLSCESTAQSQKT